MMSKFGSSVSVVQLSRACAYYLRCKKRTFSSKIYYIIIIIYTTEAWVIALWHSSIGIDAISYRLVMIAAFVSFVASFIVYFLRSLSETISTSNLDVAAAYYNNGNLDAAFLVLFSPLSVLAPRAANTDTAQMLLKATLIHTLETTSVDEARADRNVQELLSTLERIEVTSITDRVSSSPPVRVLLIERFPFLLPWLITTIISAIVIAIKSLGKP